MTDKLLETKELLPEPGSVTAVAQGIREEDVNKIALRRGKVRELVRMGYEPYQIVLILNKGIKVSDDKIVEVKISETIVKSDIEYVKQEDASIDVDFSEKRVEILEKLKFLYNRAMAEYGKSKGQAKNSFLNTALSILGKRIEIEGVKAPEVNVSLGAEARISKFALELHKLSQDDRNTIISAIRKVRERGRDEGVGYSGVSSDTPGVPTQTSNDKRVPRKP